MFEGTFAKKPCNIGQAFEFIPADESARYSITIEDVGVTYEVTGANPCLASKMVFEDLDTHCVIRSSVHPIWSE